MDEDRLKHCLAVAIKMVEIGKEKGLNEDELKDLFTIGYNHDIGYRFGSSDEHNIVGGEILKNTGYKYWKEIYYHGDINSEYQSMYLDILNEADMKIDKYGIDVGYEKRLEDIKSRYGEDSKVYKNAERLIARLKENS